MFFPFSFPAEVLFALGDEEAYFFLDVVGDICVDFLSPDYAHDGSVGADYARVIVVGMVEPAFVVFS